MKILILFFCLLLLSCQSQKNEDRNSVFHWSEEKKRQFFRDSIASISYHQRMQNYSSNILLDPDTFFSKAYHRSTNYFHNDALLYALEEKVFEEFDLKPNSKLLRISINPSFHLSYCLILEQTKTGSTLTAKCTDGAGSNRIGNLDFTISQSFDSELATQLFSKIEKMNFQDLPETDPRSVSDGEAWKVEWIAKGKYKCAHLLSPELYRVGIGNQIQKIGYELRDSSMILEHWALKSDSSQAFINFIRSH